MAAIYRYIYSDVSAFTIVLYLHHHHHHEVTVSERSAVDGHVFTWDLSGHASLIARATLPTPG